MDTTGHEKDGKYSFERLEGIFEDIGTKHVVAEIMDGARAQRDCQTAFWRKSEHIHKCKLMHSLLVKIVDC